MTSVLASGMEGHQAITLRCRFGQLAEAAETKVRSKIGGRSVQTLSLISVEDTAALSRSNTDDQIGAVFRRQCLPARRERGFVLRRSAER